MSTLKHPHKPENHPDNWPVLPYRYGFEIETLRTALAQGKTLFIKSNCRFFDYVEKRYGRPVLSKLFETDFYIWAHAETFLCVDHVLLIKQYRIDVQKQIIYGYIVSDEWVQRTGDLARDCNLAKSVEASVGYPCLKPGTHNGHVRSIQISFVNRDPRPIPSFYAPIFRRVPPNKVRRKLFDESNQVP